ncbi:membrane protein insertase YidC [Actinotalea sp. M2MS4P-6]|uniref:membrane protein insertase YidC n=1 Tax=Actinotalea sp. M2MS4P-6 TaxID=2983762 RepID=UPI0029623CDF|nr:membrane protein insertase YidC [Actinotalea sp. M2MS4P-6]
MDWFDTILYPIKVVVAYIMYGFHWLSTQLGLDPASGAAWALSIVGLVVIIRIALIPLFVRQIKAQRGLQLISPELQAIQKKYKGKSDPASREAMSRETMELYRKHGTNPFSSCLPILAQSPIFFALFRVLYRLPDVAAGNYPSAGAGGSIGPITPEVAAQATSATIFGAPISSSFMNPVGDPTATRIVTVVLIIAMSVTTFTTQRQLTQKNMPASAMQGPMAQQQKMLLYLLPLIFAISGVNFPIGVLIYWTTTNLWTMGQQFYVIRRNPTPGSEAERALKERRARKAAEKGIVLEEDRPAIEEAPRGQRQQPKRKDRQKGPRPQASGQGGQTPSDDESSHVSGSADGQKPAGPKGNQARRPKAGGATAAGATGAARSTSGSKRPAQGSGAGQSAAKTGSKAGSGTAKAAEAGSGQSGAAKPATASGSGSTQARKPRAKRPAQGAAASGDAGTAAKRAPRKPAASQQKPVDETTTPDETGTDA